MLIMWLAMSACISIAHYCYLCSQQILWSKIGILFLNNLLQNYRIWKAGRERAKRRDRRGEGERRREKRKEEIVHLLIHLLVAHSIWVWARLKPGPQNSVWCPYECQKPKHLNHDLMPTRVCISRNLKLEVEPEPQIQAFCCGIQVPNSVCLSICLSHCDKHPPLSPHFQWESF